MIIRQNAHVIHERTENGLHHIVFLTNGKHAVNELLASVLELYDWGAKHQDKPTRILADTTRIPSVPVGSALSALRRTLPTYPNPPVMQVALINHSETIATFVNGFVRMFVPNTTTFRVFTPATREQAYAWLNEPMPSE